MLFQIMLLAGFGALGFCGLWYVRALSAWRRRLWAPEVAGLPERERIAFLQSEEYRRLRNSVRAPIYTATALGAVMYLLMRLVG